jgi:flagellar hook-associated protein 3 FlgL
MRISSQQIFEAGVQSIQDHSSEAVKYQTQISSGKKYTQVSDSPQAVTLGLKLSFDKAQYDMFKTNQELMTDRLNNITSQLSSIYTAMASLKQTAIQAQGASGQSDLAALAQKAQSLSDSITQYSAAKDASNQAILKPLKDPNNSSQTYDTTLGKVQIEPGITISEGISLSESIGVYVSVTDPINHPGVDSPDVNKPVDSGPPPHVQNVLKAAQDIAAALNAGTQPTTTQLTALDNAISQVKAAQVKAGLMSKQVTSAQDSVGGKLTDLENARSTLLDTDIAEASAGLARSQTLLQAAQAIFAKMQSSTLFEKL